MKKAPSEIDLIASLAKRMTADELNEYISSRFEKDRKSFKRLAEEERARFDQVRNDPPIKEILKKAKDFYDDLIADGYVKKDFSLVEGETLEFYKLHQAREEASSYLDELEDMKLENYKGIFRKWNKFYVINYETICSEHLVELAQNVSGRCISNKSRILGILSSYRNEKHKELFRSLIPQIRNSVQHQDFIIDPKQPKITFYDRRKSPLNFSIEEYSKLGWELFFLILVFDIINFDLVSDILNVVIEAVDIVDDFAKKHNLKLAKGGNLSILDWATLIKSKKMEG